MKVLTAGVSLEQEFEIKKSITAINELTDIEELKPYAKKAKFYWCQEEPKNMGAWFSARDYIQWTLDNIKANNKMISYIGRSPDASPATGYAKRHISQQQEIIKKVFE